MKAEGEVRNCGALAKTKAEQSNAKTCIVPNKGTSCRRWVPYLFLDFFKIKNSIIIDLIF